MALRGILLLMVALAAAGTTAVLARNWMSAERAAFLASVPKVGPKRTGVRVLVADQTLAAGTFVTKDRVTWRPWPEDGLAEGYAVEGRRRIEDFEGAVVRATVTAGEPLTDARVVHPGERGFLAAVLTPGKRAVSVPINATTGISGFVFPGDRVDVILTMSLRAQGAGGKDRNRYFSETLLGDIRILAIDQKAARKDGEVVLAKTATMEVTPKQAEKIALALEMGSLSLSLQSLAREPEGAPPLAGGRGYTLDTDVRTMGALLDEGPAAGRPKRRVNVIRGQQAEQVIF